MKVEIMAVYDSAAKRFIEPFPSPTVEIAQRSFGEVSNKPGTDFNKYPTDYTLFHCGTFDQETGAIHPLNTPHSLGLAANYLIQHAPPEHGEQLDLRENGNNAE